MDGKGRWIDNVFVERLWRSVKYEDIYLRAYATPLEVATRVTRYFSFYNERRGHQSLDLSSAGFSEVNASMSSRSCFKRFELRSPDRNQVDSPSFPNRLEASGPIEPASVIEQSIDERAPIRLSAS
jgi:putative transposase